MSSESQNPSERKFNLQELVNTARGLVKNEPLKDTIPGTVPSKLSPDRTDEIREIVEIFIADARALLEKISAPRSIMSRWKEGIRQLREKNDALQNKRTKLESRKTTVEESMRTARLIEGKEKETQKLASELQTLAGQILSLESDLARGKETFLQQEAQSASETAAASGMEKAYLAELENLTNRTRERMKSIFGEHEAEHQPAPKQPLPSQVKKSPPKNGTVKRRNLGKPGRKPFIRTFDFGRPEQDDVLSTPNTPGKAAPKKESPAPQESANASPSAENAPSSRGKIVLRREAIDVLPEVTDGQIDALIDRFGIDRTDPEMSALLATVRWKENLKIADVVHAPEIMVLLQRDLKKTFLPASYGKKDFLEKVFAAGRLLTLQHARSTLIDPENVQTWMSRNLDPTYPLNDQKDIQRYYDLLRAFSLGHMRVPNILDTRPMQADELEETKRIAVQAEARLRSDIQEFISLEAKRIGAKPETAKDSNAIYEFLSLAVEAGRKYLSRDPDGRVRNAASLMNEAEGPDRVVTTLCLMEDIPIVEAELRKRTDY